jgi:hypothetical protein
LAEAVARAYYILSSTVLQYMSSLN